MKTIHDSIVTIIEQAPVRLIGLRARTTMDNAAVECPALFTALATRASEIATNGDGASYGVSFPVEGEPEVGDYWAALPVAPDAPVPAGMVTCELPGGIYARCEFESLSQIYDVFQVLARWLSTQNNYIQRTDAPCYEYYPADSGHPRKGTVFVPLDVK